jgi:Polyphosphate kinase 2 (PPK2)
VGGKAHAGKRPGQLAAWSQPRANGLPVIEHLERLNEAQFWRSQANLPAGRGSRQPWIAFILPSVWVDDSEDDDPVLRQADGSVIDTWREDYPYDTRLDRDSYEHHKRPLQVELLKLQYWVKETGRRVVVLFEGQDVAGKAVRSSGSPSICSPSFSCS